MSERWYRGYGLNIRSEIDLPEFPPGDPAQRDPAQRNPDADIRIRLDPGARAACEAVAPDARADAEFARCPLGGCAMEVAGIGHFWVRDGRDIAIAPASGQGADSGMLRLYTIGSAMGMALHQRGLLVLHGATVVNEAGRAVILVGDSGEGKSTLAAYLGRRGYAILGDDTMVAWPAGRGFELWPGSRVFKLWADTLEALGAPPSDFPSVGNRLDKYFVPNPDYAPDAGVPLSEVIVLDSVTQDLDPRIEEVGGLNALRAIAANTYRPGYAALLGREAEHFHQCAALAQAVPVARLTRPWDAARIGEGLDLLRARWDRAIADQRPG